MRSNRVIRHVLSAFGLATGAIVVALVARYGYITSDTPIDHKLTAILFSIVAIIGIAGPAVAVRLYRSHAGLAKLWGIFAGVVAIAALLANLSNSLGAIADLPENTPAHVADFHGNHRAELQRVTAERAALHFTVTTEAAVAAARDVLLAADAARRAECGERRGVHCQEFVADLTAKREAFAALLKNRADAEHAEKLDAEAASIHERLDSTSAAPAINSQTASIGLIFRLPDAASVTLQHVAAVVMAELLIAFSLIAWELLGVNPRTTEIVRQTIGRVPVGATKKREPAASGDLAIFVQDCMRPAGGETVELHTLYSRFLEWCDEHQLSPLPPKKFSKAFITRCEEAHIDVRCEGTKVLCLDVQLAPVDLWYR